MKFIALALVAIVAAEEKKEEGDDYKKAGAGQPCDASKEKSGCIDKHRCASLTGEGPGACSPEDLCGTEVMGVSVECGAKTLLASTFAALALASTM